MAGEGSWGGGSCMQKQNPSSSSLAHRAQAGLLVAQGSLCLVCCSKLCLTAGITKLD